MGNNKRGLEHMNMQPEMNAVEQDKQAFDSAHTRTHQELLTFAARRSGLSPLALGRDFLRHSRSGRGVEMADYVRHELWNRERHGPDGADRFVGAKTVWPAANTVNPFRWWAAAEDKYVMTLMLAAEGLAQPQTVAVVDNSARAYPGIPRAATPEALREVVLAHPAGTLFAKTLDGMIGNGAMVIEAADAETITCTGTGPKTYEQFLSQVLDGQAYLIQKRLDNHASLAPFCTGLATIRLPNFIRGTEVYSPVAALKLPSGGNVACAFWRPGNLACGIDPETGTITRVAGRDGPVSVELEDHPETPGLKGLTLPFWDEVREINERAARVFGAIPYQSTDIAVTPNGPVLIELNYGGSFDILQNGTGKGLLSPEIRAFFAAHGYPFAPGKRKKRFGLV
ncbi:sugar-transfer associated ATP-grasp domain-containing protein [Actibacterium sp. MT2.3-13A]|uniref:sugar-transfer associated ATP-grasp domain-containing protein n=1 Tax=Actibacterium sp. MT2.3-13A TaxID=2828332 RepID=UPI001BAB55E7|nr:sugar-transfer associated ATP-grasp domain-containing protein [Actibacterium sp. MT2.3-13A]